MDTPKKDSRCVEDGKMLIEGRIEMVRLETCSDICENEDYVLVSNYYKQFSKNLNIFSLNKLIVMMIAQIHVM